MKYPKCFVALIFAISAYGQVATDISSLLRQAKYGNVQAVEALGRNPSQEAQVALSQLAELPSSHYFNLELRTARARHGDPGALLDIAKDIFWRDPATFYEAVIRLDGIEGVLPLRAIRVVLDDDTGGSRGGDVVYFSNAQNAVGLLPNLVAPPETFLKDGYLLPVLVARKQWHAWFANHEPVLPPSQIAALAEEARKRGSIADLAAVAVLANGGGEQVLLAVGQDSSNEQIKVFQKVIRVAEGAGPCDDEIVRLIRTLPSADQRVVLKTLAFLRYPEGFWILCRFRSAVRKDRRKQPKELTALVETMLRYWQFNGSQIVAVYEEPTKFQTCDGGVPRLSCLLGSTK